MAKKINTILETSITESNNKKHRYILSKIWDNKKPIATIITLYPNTHSTISIDLTTMLIINNLYSLNFGGFYNVNLFSSYEVDKTNYAKCNTVDNDTFILDCCKLSDVIILAYGTLPLKNKDVAIREKELLEKVQKTISCDKIKILTDSKKLSIHHPLSQKIRKQWELSNL